MSAFLRTISRAATSTPATAAARTFSSTAARPFARVTILGNVGTQPELRKTTNGREFVHYVVASSQGSSDRTSWFHINGYLDDSPRRNHLLSLTKGCVDSLVSDMPWPLCHERLGLTRVLKQHDCFGRGRYHHGLVPGPRGQEPHWDPYQPPYVLASRSPIPPCPLRLCFYIRPQLLTLIWVCRHCAGHSPTPRL